MGGMTQAVDARLGEAAGSRRRPPRSRRGSMPGRTSSSASTSTGWTRKSPVDVREIDNSAVRRAQVERLAQVRAKRDARRSRRGARGADRSARATARAICSSSRFARPRARDRGRDIGRAGGGLGPLSRDDADRVRRVRCAASRTTATGRAAERDRRNRRCRGPPAAADDREAGPGRARPRRQGRRHGLRRPRLRRRHRTAVPDAGGSRAAGDRKRRARGRRLDACRRPQDAGAGDHRRASRRKASTTSSCSSVA